MSTRAHRQTNVSLFAFAGGPIPTNAVEDAPPGTHTIETRARPPPALTAVLYHARRLQTPRPRTRADLLELDAVAGGVVGEVVDEGIEDGGDVDPGEVGAGPFPDAPPGGGVQPPEAEQGAPNPSMGWGPLRKAPGGGRPAPHGPCAAGRRGASPAWPRPGPTLGVRRG